MSKAPTLFNAVRDFLGPLMAEYCRLIDEGDPDLRVTITIGGYECETTLKSIKDLDHAYRAAFQAKETRRERRGNGPLFEGTKQ